MDTEFFILGWQQFHDSPVAIFLYSGPVIAFILFAAGVIIYSRYSSKSDLSEIMKDIDESDHKDSALGKEGEEAKESKEDDKDDPQGATEDPEDLAETTTQAKPWLKKLSASLAKTRSQISSAFSELLSEKTHVEESDLEQIKKILIQADVGVKTADALLAQLQQRTSHGPLSARAAITLLGDHMVEMLEANKVEDANRQGLQIILMVGVNGVGKTTSTGKLAHHFSEQNKRVMLCAADTYRAGAIDQLKVWGERLSMDVVAMKQGSDPAAVCYQGVEKALSQGCDVLLVDTAGRLHNKTDLMDELGKIQRVMKKLVADAPHEVFLVIDGTTGQNAAKQVEAFKAITALTGIIVTKLDGTAKGGAVAGIAREFQLPVKFIGLGEQASDLSVFHPRDFVSKLLDIEEIFARSDSTTAEKTQEMKKKIKEETASRQSITTEEIP